MPQKWTWSYRHLKVVVASSVSGSGSDSALQIYKNMEYLHPGVAMADVAHVGVVLCQ